MATGEQFGYGLLGGLTYGTASGAMQQALGTITAGSTNAVNISYNPYLASNQWYVTSGTSDMTITGVQAHRAERKCDGCGAKSGEAHYADCEALKDRCDCHVGRASKVHSVAWRLRKEIEDWHGDILERQAA